MRYYIITLMILLVIGAWACAQELPKSIDNSNGEIGWKVDDGTMVLTEKDYRIRGKREVNQVLRIKREYYICRYRFMIENKAESVYKAHLVIALFNDDGDEIYRYKDITPRVVKPGDKMPAAGSFEVDKQIYIDAKKMDVYATFPKVEGDG